MFIFAFYLFAGRNSSGHSIFLNVSQIESLGERNELKKNAVEMDNGRQARAPTNWRKQLIR